MVIKNGMIHDGLGNVFKGDIRILQGKFAQIGENLEDEEILDVSGCQVFPGFIDPNTVWGINGSTSEVKPSSEDNEELTGPILPELEIVYAVSGRALEVQQMPAFGITACGVVPTAVNLFGGQISVFYTHGKRALQQCLKRNAAMAVSVSSDIQSIYGAKGIGPMTKMAIFQSLKKTLRDALSYRNQKDGAVQDDKLQALSFFIQDKRPFFLYCDNAGDRERVYELMEPLDVPIVFMSHDGLRTGEIWTGHKNFSMICGFDGINLYPERKYTEEQVWAELYKNHTMLSASGRGRMSYGRENYIWSAIELMRGLGDEEEVVKCMTSSPAKMLGIDDMTGSIQTGKNADIVIWTENPLKTFEAHVKYTMIQGRIVYKEGDERRCYY